MIRISEVVYQIRVWHLQRGLPVPKEVTFSFADGAAAEQAKDELRRELYKMFHGMFSIPTSEITLYGVRLRFVASE